MWSHNAYMTDLYGSLNEVSNEEVGLIEWLHLCNAPLYGILLNITYTL